MRTKKAIATISYNTCDYLELKLDTLVADEIISFWAFVKHQREDDEAKDHIHLFIQPNRIIDTMHLQKELRELDPSHPIKPLGCIDFKSSDPDEWLLYCRHYKPYLMSKGQVRTHEYSFDKFYYSSIDDFEFMWEHSLTSSKWALSYNLCKDIENCTDPVQLINSGRVPLGLANSLLAYNKMKVFRNGRVSHTPNAEVK